MNLTQPQIDFINQVEFGILATTSGAGLPRAIFAAPMDVFPDRIVISDCKMRQTRDNILENPNVQLLFFDEPDKDRCLRVDGVAQYNADDAAIAEMQAREAAAEYSARSKGIIEIAITNVQDVQDLVN
ncbi:hypothetical protein FACS189421_02780 [Bacteroidia bacterium]|nr:hypothetical protein FACS189421_02780 [Bacteroidia bacterium]